MEPEHVQEIVDMNTFIREHQTARAYSFPAAFAPDGRLRETESNHYMTLMGMYYKYNKSSEDLTLELRQELSDGRDIKYATVGAVYSVDLFWSEVETIRLHLIASRRYHNYMVEHYSVYDMGEAGNAYSLPALAWDNWRILGQSQTEGIHVDKRLLFLVLGDRSQILNMKLDEFCRLNADQVEQLQDRMRPGMHLVRPSIEEACLNEIPERLESPIRCHPIVELSSSSSDSDTKGPSSEQGSDLPSTSASSSRGRGGTSSRRRRGGLLRGASLPGSRRSLFMGNKPPPPFTHRGPRGPLSKEQVERMTQIFNDVMWSHHAPPMAMREDPRPAEEGRRSTIPGPAKPATMGSPEASHEASPDQSPTLSERSHEEFVPFLEETSVEDNEEIEEDLSGFSSLAEVSLATNDYSMSSSTDWNGPGPLPMDDSVEVFLAKCLSEGDIVNVSTSEDGGDNLSKGQASVSDLMDVQGNPGSEV